MLIIVGLRIKSVDNGWIALREGVDRLPLAKNDERGIQADIIRLAPNHVDLAHTHDDFEWVYILEGQFTDDVGVHKAGDFVINSTESIHQPRTGPDGCTLLIVWTGSVTHKN